MGVKVKVEVNLEARKCSKAREENEMAARYLNWIVYCSFCK